MFYYRQIGSGTVYIQPHRHQLMHRATNYHSSNPPPPITSLVLPQNFSTFKVGEAHLIQVAGHAIGTVVPCRVEAGLAMPRHVHHDQVPALGQVSGHHHPHCLIGAESMHKDHRHFGRGGGGGGQPLKVAEVDAPDLDELAAEPSIQVPTKPVVV